MNTIDTIQTSHAEHAQGQSSTLLSARTLGICLALAALAIAAVTIFKISLSTLGFAAILLVCPLLHVWMMRDGGHKH